RLARMPLELLGPLLMTCAVPPASPLHRRWHRLPSPCGNPSVTGISTRSDWLNEGNQVHVVSDAVAYRTQSIKRVGRVGRHQPRRLVVLKLVVTLKSVVHGRDPPPRLPNGREP